MTDIPEVVADIEARGYTVEEPTKSFALSFEGCRRLEDEAWEILVAQHKLAEKRAVCSAPDGRPT
ncbi:hypothetical protein [Pandoraea horticolens]|uniref:hypothetical protein n=1 Tax=Pandoraea horticolens TaxID=2508298 RepID=UPI001241CC58|nr:hypothetical protein [Pandoraea horticolens]